MAKPRTAVKPKPIVKLLVANRGEIARRIFRTCRKMGIATVAVYSETDAREPFVGEADEAVPLGGTTPAKSYLRREALVEAARKAGADAVHPGYGFLSENASFAQMCRDAGLNFVGPSAEAIAAMGIKPEAKKLAARVGVPTLPTVELDELEPPARHAAADKLGWPVLLKAAAGGGGKGMRVVRDPRDLEPAIASAGREAAAAFGDGRLFLEPYLESPRHVEVQVFGDNFGRVVHLFERDCSVQRRHQKLIEECPSPAVDERLRESLGAAAVAVASAVQYTGAGTVEFLLDLTRSFYFLEMNTRLQVEHPVTEEVTGLDLVRLQLMVAQGEPLPREAVDPVRKGCAIEARLYAEDPARDFLPSPGTVTHVRWPEQPGIRVEATVAEGSAVGVHYDSLLAKVIAHGPSRVEAARKLAGALSDLRLHGLTTNRDLLLAVLRHPEFMAGQMDTGFLGRNPPQSVSGTPARATEEVHALAATLACHAARRAEPRAAGFAPSGWRNNPSQPQCFELSGQSGTLRVEYEWRRSGLWLAVGGEEGGIAHALSPSEVELEWRGLRRRYFVRREGRVHHVDSALGYTPLTEVERFPPPLREQEQGALVSPLPGTVRELPLEAGASVAAGEVVAVIEAMKMEHRVRAPRPGRLRELRVTVGQTVPAGEVLAVIEDHPAS